MALSLRSPTFARANAENIYSTDRYFLAAVVKHNHVGRHTSAQPTKIFFMITLYGIKNCDTVKKSRDWLAKNNIDYRFHDFRADGLDKTQVKNWIAEIGLENLVNKRSTTWKALDESVKENFNEQNAVAVIVENPTLIKRPLLDTDKQKYVGFKETDYTKIFS